MARNHRRFVFAFAAVYMVLWANACGEGGTVPPAPEVPRPTSVVVTPNTATLTALGATVQVSAQVADQNGRPMPGTAVAWTSSQATVATVDAGGLVTAVGNGTAAITATAGSASGTATVTVAQTVTALTVSPEAGVVAIGDTVRLSAAALDANGHAVPEPELAWSSSDPQVATVDDEGLVSGIAAGMTTITAASDASEGSSDISVLNPDREALVAFHEATRGSGWIENEGWLSDRPIGEWHGVTTGENGRVTGLNLRASNLVGPLPPVLAHLSRLKNLNLERNELTGPIPPELATLTSLETLILGVNGLTGPIPAELGDLSNLQVLRLRRNSLTGPVPSELTKLSNLTRLGLERNRLEGPLPLGLLELDRLRYLHFADNAGVCASGSTDFLAWLAQLEVYVGNLCNAGDRQVLVSLYEETGGTNWTESDGWLGEGALGEWQGVAVDDYGYVIGIDLAENGLAGRISASLPDLGRLVSLRIEGNGALTGALPMSLATLSLDEFHYQGTGLCIPADRAFAEWLDAIASHEGSGAACAPLTDREVLALVYAATGGADWHDAGNWLSDRPVGEWHGVRTDDAGQVTALELGRNNLVGSIPSEVGSLSALETLYLPNNSLSGRLPPEIGNLASLKTLDLYNNALSGPIPARIGSLSALESLFLSRNHLTGPIPPEIEDLSSLRRLELASNALSGPIPAGLGDRTGLTRLDLGYNALSGPVPAALGNLSALEVLRLGGNSLTGEIPAELGNLSALFILDLVNNDLTGSIPAELGNLASLESLTLFRNGLAGPIPGELGNLANLNRLELGINSLTGPIPPELGRLSRLETLNLSYNGLAGPIPPEFGNLTSLRWLYLPNSDLNGPIPPELGNMASLRWLDLSRNALTGSIPNELGSLAELTGLAAPGNQLSGSLPAELGNLTGLSTLRLFDNTGMTGPLPQQLTDLVALRELSLGGTDLCAPGDAAFQGWLTAVRNARVQSCRASGSSRAYLTQAVQSLTFPVPLVAGEPALLRVFVTASRAGSAGLPPVRATFYVDNVETHTIDIPGSSTPIPTVIGDAESSLSQSVNAEIPASVVQPGLEMVVEIDPDNTLDAGLGVAKRIPDTGRQPVRVTVMPPLELTFVPFLWALGSDSSIVDLAEGMAADPDGHEMLGLTHAFLPINELDVRAHEPVLTSTTNVFALINETDLIRVMEAGTGYYMGILSEGVVGGQSGVARLGGRASFSSASGFVIAHELGHNLSLGHAPCGTTGEPAFPHSDGSIGAWGYDFRGTGTLIPPHLPDLMSYCGPPYAISDYSFTRALNHRSGTDVTAAAHAYARSAAPTRTILLWGGIDEQNQPYLEPAFLADAAPTLPESRGEYRLTGRDAAGGEVFSLSFDMPELADGNGRSSFVFALPVQDEWAGELERITLSGPAGSVSIDGETDQPMTILRDPGNGQVRAILRDAPLGTMQEYRDVVALPPGSALEALLSRGLPDPAEWRRD